MVRIIGLGNEWAGDDAVGLIAARMLKEHMQEKQLSGIEVGSREVPEWEMFEQMQPDDLLIFIDACDSGAEPGTVFELQVDELMGQGVRHCSSHGLGLAHWLSMAEVLGAKAGHVSVFAVELAETAMGSGLSAAVEQSLAELLRRIEMQTVRHLEETSGEKRDA